MWLKSCLTTTFLNEGGKRVSAILSISEYTIIYTDCVGMSGGKRKKTCMRCSSALPPRRIKWCSNKCSNWWFDNHWYFKARRKVVLKARVLDKRKVLGYTCAICNTLVQIIEVDHIIRAMGTHNILSCLHHQDNLRVLCIPCHRIITKEQRKTK